MSQTQQSCCCCGPSEQNSEEQSVTVMPKKETVQVDSLLSWKDYIGFVAMRLGFDRDRYAIEPGLYSIGSPDTESPVLVTANYKMTFDVLRSHLNGVKAWILVLDTHGVNVWCAAGKGTFGTEELVRQLERNGIASIVSHRNLIVPQLAGPGIAAHEVKKQTGFKVNYGPVHAKDIKPYLESGMKATSSMRNMEFPFQDRIVLAPLELVVMFKWFCLLAVLICLITGFRGFSYSVESILQVGIPSVGILVTCWLAAAFLIPALLPCLPGRMLSVKGLCVGVLLSGIVGFFWWRFKIPFDNSLSMGGFGLIVVALSSYFGLILTGSMPYTSLSGVKKEMRKSVPVIVFLFVSGMVLWTIGRFT